MVVSLLVSFLKACSKFSAPYELAGLNMCFFRITWASFLFFNIDLMLFFNIDLMLKMQLLGTPPNSNRCTGGAPNRASSLQVLPFAASFSQHFRRVAFPLHLVTVSFWIPLAPPLPPPRTFPIRFCGHWWYPFVPIGQLLLHF